MKTLTSTPTDIFALKCLDCCGGDWEPVINCSANDCPLIHVRPKGRKDALRNKYWDQENNCLKAIPTPKKRTLNLTDEQRAARSERMRGLHASRNV